MPLPRRISSSVSMPRPDLLANYCGSRFSALQGRVCLDLGPRRKTSLLRSVVAGFRRHTGCFHLRDFEVPAARVMSRSMPARFKPVQAKSLSHNRQTDWSSTEDSYLNRTDAISRARDLGRLSMHWDPGPSTTSIWWDIPKKGMSGQATSIKVDEGLNSFVRHRE